MRPSYDSVNNYITGAFLSEFLRIGDTFHLIVFSGSPTLDAARKVQERGDIETIIGRMMLHYPVENGNDLKSALVFVEEYVSSLPLRPKKIVIVSLGGSDVNNIISASKQKLSAKNTTLDFVQVTSGQSLTNLPVSGRTKIEAANTPSVSSSQRPAAETSAAGQTQTLPSQSQSQPLSQTQQSQQTQTHSQSQTQTQQSQSQTQIQTQQSQSQTQTMTQDNQETKTAEKTDISQADNVSSAVSTESRTISDTSGTNETVKIDTKESENKSVYLKQETSSTSSFLSLPLIIVFIILAVLILGLIIFFATRRLGSSPNRVMAKAASPESSRYKTKSNEEKFTDHSKDLAIFAASKPKQRTTPYSDRPVKKEISKPADIHPDAPLLLNLFVEDQNTAIGKRNIHSLKSGYSLSIGGGKSDFLIFLVPIPSNIGEIRRNGSQCTFIVKKPKYFPDISSNDVKDCINKNIRIISDKNYELRFRFEMYEDPLISLNKILRSVNVPGYHV